MMLKLTYGDISFYGGGNHSLLIKSIEGLSIVEKEYGAITYPEEDGQETISERGMPRAITFSVDVVNDSVAGIVRQVLKALSKPDYLYIYDNGLERRIFCSQVKIADPERLLRGQISSFVVQFICDNPYFEDVDETVRIIYGREKNITTPFTLPRAFALFNQGTYVQNNGDRKIEPVFEINCNETLNESTYIDLFVGDNSIRINDYTPKNGDVITIDVKERAVVSSKQGNLINNISDASYLGKLVLNIGETYISAVINNITADIGMRCIYRNYHSEAVII